MISARFVVAVNSVERDSDDEFAVTLEAVAFATLDIIRRFVISRTSLINWSLECVVGCIVILIYNFVG
jgi:hypothetical protein